MVRAAAPVRSSAQGEAALLTGLRVLNANADKLAAHDEFMRVVSKASGGKVLWQ